MKKFSDFDIKNTAHFVGDKVKMVKVLNKEVIIHDYKVDVSKFLKNKSGNVLPLQFELSGEKQIIFTGSDVLIDQIVQVQKEDFPFLAVIVKNGEHFEFN